MSTLTVESLRRDGKYMVRLEFPGAPNAFGGHYPARIFRKLWDRERLMRELVNNILTPGRAETFGVPPALQQEAEKAVANIRAAADAALHGGPALCRCMTPGAEWSGSPSEDLPDTVWTCDDCGRRVPAAREDA